jgi:ATP-binding cassette subfamily B protein
MIIIDWKVALIVAILTPMSMFVAGFIASRTFSLFKKRSATSAEQTALLDEAVGGREVITAFSHQKDSLAAFDEINERYRKVTTNAVYFSSITNPATRFVNNLVYFGVALVSALLSIGTGSTITPGGISTLLTYASNYAKPFNELSGVITELQSSLASALRVFELLDAVEMIPDAADAAELSPESLSGRLEAHSLAFSYNDKPFMENMNFWAKPGQRIAIVGPTGCGKTTLINLLMRFYDVDSGSIQVGGTDIRDITRHSLRTSYGMVLQETWLKAATVRENLKLGRPDATDEEMIDAAKRTHCHGFISRLDDGYDTLITENGGELSAGQKQLLCIARAMISDPPMLILDEATSSIDTRTELRVQNAMRELMEGRTSFVVAHRLSTIMEMDKILVMKDGNVIEQGTHAELMDNGGFYRDLFNSQFAE